MYNYKEYEKLKKKYGPYSSWAIWDECNQKDTSVIETNLNELNTNYVFVGLNISRLLREPSWSNFHGGRHDRKLMYACNDTKLRGSYITDIFKDLPKTRASEVKKYLEEHPKFLEENVSSFKKEMVDIEISRDTVFVVLGNDARRYFKKYFQNGYENKPVYYCHYSSRGTDEDWVNGLWKILRIDKVFKREEMCQESRQIKA